MHDASPTPHKTMKPPLIEFKLGRAEVAHRVISEKFREAILSGSIVAGTELPSTGELAELWKTSKSTVHTALCNLVKEGLLERNHGSATYVRKQPLALTRVGIYYDAPMIWFDEEQAFIRSMQRFLESKLAEMGMKISVFVDRRPKDEQNSVQPELQEAIRLRKIQGLIIVTGNSTNLAALLKISIPASVLTSATGITNKVSIDEKGFFQGFFSRLAKQGCRSVGLISSIETQAGVHDLSEHLSFTSDFLRAAKSHGMETRKEWIRVPRNVVSEKAWFGYREFHQMWKQAEHPEAVVVFPDMVVKGVISASLELGVHLANDTTFCFHRNANVDMLCPFPAIWSIFDESKVADGLIELVRRQHAGERFSAVHVSPEIKQCRRTVPLCPPSETTLKK